MALARWLGKQHPDQKGNQFKILREALENLLNGKMQIEMDLPMQFLGETQVLSAEKRGNLKDAYIWFDWFSIPKIDVKSGSGDEMSEEVFRAVKSIPFYVESCQLFIALAPTLSHNESGVQCDYCSYLLRGWCSLEIWCNLLSNKAESPMILVRRPDQADFAMPIHWVHSSPHTGHFAVESDREKVQQVMEQALNSRVRALQESGEKQDPLGRAPSLGPEPWQDLLRYLEAARHKLLGEAPRQLEEEAFERRFRAPAPPGLSPLACAVLSEDQQSVRRLLAEGGRLRQPGIAEAPKGWVGEGGAGGPHAGPHRGAPGGAEQRGGAAAALGGRLRRERLQLRGHVGLGLLPHHGGASLTGVKPQSQAVHVLLEGRADVNYAGAPCGLTPLATACLFCSPSEAEGVVFQGSGPPGARRTDLLKAIPKPFRAFKGHGLLAWEVIGLLIDAMADVNLRGYGGAGAPLTTLAVASEGNPHLEDQVQLLLAARADVNLPGEPSGALKLFELACRATSYWT